MKFELLPSEIIIECCEYIDIFDIFHSFDQLNYRFSKLIRIIPLHLNFQHVRKTKFDKFCQKMLSNPEIRQQIYSLHLSNKDTCGQIKEFFSVNQFSHLHTLRLTHIEEENISQLQSLLPTLSKLYSFHLISPQIDEDGVVSVLPISNLRRLSLLTLRSFLLHTQQPTLITHLKVFNCSLEQLLYQLFQYVPLLKYFNIGVVTKYNRSIMNNTIIHAVHLKQLIIGKFRYKFEDFRNFVKQIPNLQSLTISADGDIEMLNANQWENLIISSLPYLNIFKFKFSVDRRYKNIIMLSFEQFHSEFWVKQHHWYTQLLLEKESLCIYSIPYLSNTFKLEPSINTIYNESVDISNVFDNVTDLTLSHEEIKKNESQYIFTNIISLKLVTSKQELNVFLTQIQNIVNLSNLKHLDISTCQRVILSGELLEILKESPQLSSMTIKQNDLILLYHNNQLCQYINKMIKKLNINKHNHFLFDNFDELNKFCLIFSNIEQLICSIMDPIHVIVPLCQLSKLSTIHIYLSLLPDHNSFQFLLTQLLNGINFNFRIRGMDVYEPQLFIWIDKNIN
jgi:hypothetical protein